MGPKTEYSQALHREKYRAENETFDEFTCRLASCLCDYEEHYKHFRRLLADMRFLPAGRIQLAIGGSKSITPFNCFVSGKIDDSIEGIMNRLSDAAHVLKMGGGIGYDFSTLRPHGDIVHSVDGPAGGPVNFMTIYDSMCKCIASTGNRRGAQMGVLRVDHPDIESFINAKQDGHSLTAFNTSVGVTDDFMRAVEMDSMFELKFNGHVYRKIRAQYLWDKIMRSTWDWSEPGILFLDTINQYNNLYYLENIQCTNPCAEQCLPPWGACLLGSFNLTQYIIQDNGKYVFDYNTFQNDIPCAVRALDNVISVADYPLEEYANEELSKRRIGIGVTGLANAVEAMGYSYGSLEFLEETKKIMATLLHGAYLSSINLAIEKGPFPLFDANKYIQSDFIQQLPFKIIDKIRKHGIRNSHLISIAPAGTMSLCADNVSSGIEPVFSYVTSRLIRQDDGERVVTLKDYGYEFLGVEGQTCHDISVMKHLAVLATVQKFVDSSVSKTCNVGDNIVWEGFKDVYMKAWKMGCKGCTTFRLSGKRKGILQGQAVCEIDPVTGRKTCIQ
jgi:ribonucleoside-diphosphate reductase alpha chain